MSGNTTRRALLAQAAALGAALAFGPGGARASSQLRTERRDLFPQGVASGDPAPDSVILWTRRAPDAGVSQSRLIVEVAKDEAFERVVARGDAEVSAATDWTCRFLAAGLKPAREYWYRFVDDAGNMSRVGRTITAPKASDDRAVRFAFVSCQDVTNGALNAYRRMIYEDMRRPRAEQLSFVLHLGDFVYEIVKYPEDAPTASIAAGACRAICAIRRARRSARFIFRPASTITARYTKSISPIPTCRMRAHAGHSCLYGTITNFRGKAFKASSPCSTIRRARLKR